MDSNNELKEIDIKNRKCHYFDDTIKIEDFDLDNILIHEKPYENILVYNISYKNLIAQPLCIRFANVDGFIRDYDRARYSVLFGSEKYYSIYNKIRYLIGVKGGITYVVCHDYSKNQSRFIRFFTSGKNNDFS